MLNCKTIVALLAATTLTACGGTALESGAFRISDGALKDVDIPTGTNLSRLPQPVQDAIGDFDELNISNNVTQSVPAGAPVFRGTVAMLVTPKQGEPGGSVMSADVEMTANFATMEFDGLLSKFAAAGPDGTELEISGTVPVDTTIRSRDSEVGFDGTMFGTLIVEEESYSFNGLLDGAYIGETAQNAIGETSGTIGNPDGSEDYISGVLILSQ